MNDSDNPDKSGTPAGGRGVLGKLYDGGRDLAPAVFAGVVATGAAKTIGYVGGKAIDRVAAMFVTEAVEETTGAAAKNMLGVSGYNAYR